MISYFITKVNDISIRNKLLISYTLVVIMPVMLIGIMLTLKIKDLTVDKSKDEAKTNVERIKRRFVETTRIAEDITYRAQMDTKLTDIVLKEYVLFSQFISDYYEYNEFKRSNEYFNEVSDIILYTYNKSILNSGQFIQITDEVESQEWFEIAKEKNGLIIWQYDQKAKALFLSCKVKEYTSGNSFGVIKVDIDNQYLKSILENEPYESYIINDRDYIIASNQVDKIGHLYNTKYSPKRVRIIEEKFKLSDQNKMFKIVSIVPINRSKDAVDQALKLSAIIIGSTILGSVFLIILFSNMISRRVQKIRNDMHIVAMGDFNHVAGIKGQDEIGQLADDLDTMTKSLKKLVHEVYEVKLNEKQLMLKQKEIELKVLTNQINPHFLFNILETIRMKAHCSGAAEIAQAVKLLGKMMRKNIESTNELISIKAELETIKCYLDIQRFRLGDKIKYSIDVEENLLNKMILPFTIQPLVENAIVHGISTIDKNCIINIKIKKVNNVVKIIVADNGSGIKQNKLKEIIRYINDAALEVTSSVGLRNVNQRIKLYYGNTYRMYIYSKYNVGTTVKIIIPAN